MFRDVKEMTTQELENELEAISLYEKEITKVNVNSLLNQNIDTSFLHSMNCTITPNGHIFRTDRQGFLPEIMEKMYNDRVKYKSKQIETQKKYEVETNDSVKAELKLEIARYKNLQLAKKVGLNSAYGALGNNFFRFYDIRQAEGITLAGQLSIRWIENRINEYMNKILKSESVDYVLASDTDSIYLHLGPLVEAIVDSKKSPDEIIAIMDKVCETKLQPFIDKSYQDLAEYVSAFAQKMKMKREALADKAIWTAKKRYILNVYNNEGVQYAQPKIKIQGLEAVKSSTPSACRMKIKDALNIILQGSETELQEFIQKFRDEFRNLPPEEIAFPRSVNGLKEYGDSRQIYKKGTPIHVKGSLIYNNELEKRKLYKKYQKIQEGEKIKFIYLKEPNFFQSPVISFLNTVPKELEIDKAIDYETQFQKSFVDPLKIILDCINWQVEKTSSLDSFFS